MKIATKMAVGSGLLVLPLVGILGYHVGQLERLAKVNREITSVQFSAGKEALSILRQIDLLSEYSRKYQVTSDWGYLSKLTSAQHTLSLHLHKLTALALSAEERRAAATLSKDWERTRHSIAMVTLVRATGQQTSPREIAAHKVQAKALRVRLRGLRERAKGVIAASEGAIEAVVRSSAKMGRRAERLSWTVVGPACVLSLLILFLGIRSINKPLRGLIAGTEAVARGEFGFQIAPSKGDELSRLTEAFNIMLERLGRLEALKKDFLSHVSHELRTPLVAMQETNRLLLDEIPGPLTDKQRRFLELNIDGGRRLAAMITNLLELSHLEAGVSYTFSRQDLVGLANVAVAEFEARAREKQIALILKPSPSPLFVRCDRDRMIQVFENLLENAIKFSPRDSEVRIQIGAPSAFSEQFPESWCRTLSESVSEGGVGVASIADSGEGIPREQREKVFNKFYQLNGNQRRSGGGVGLGLAICREIVEAHQGAIWVTDTEPTGATFYILLPRFTVLAEEPQDSPLLGEARAEESRA